MLQRLFWLFQCHRNTQWIGTTLPNHKQMHLLKKVTSMNLLFYNNKFFILNKVSKLPSINSHFWAMAKVVIQVGCFTWSSNLKRNLLLMARSMVGQCAPFLKSTIHARLRHNGLKFILKYRFDFMVLIIHVL